MLHCLVYLSASHPDLTEDDLEQILKFARKNNESLNITGVLIYGEGSFIQVLEGEKETVNQLYKHIRRDSRHFNLIKLLSMPIDERSFPKWRMGFKRVKEIEEINLLQKNFDLSNPHFKELPTQNPEVLSLLKTFTQYNYN